MKDQALWARIAAFNFPNDDQGHGLADRLRNETGWPDARVAVAMTEYRRFLYLYGLSKTARRVPGGALDRVWRVHRADATGYDAACQALFGRTLPYSDRVTGRDQELIRKAYRKEFGSPAPAAFWPDPNARLFRVAAVILALAGLVLTVVSGSFWPLALGMVIAVTVLISPRAADTYAMGDHALGGWDAGGGDGGGGGGDGCAD